MIKKRVLIALGAFSAALTACGADITAPPPPPGATAGTSSVPSGVGGSPGSTAGGSTAAGSPAAVGGTGVVPGTGGTGPTPTGGSSGTPSTAGTPGTGGTVTTMGPACAPGVPASSQIPRLLNRQYDAVMRDLLNVTTLAGANNQPPSSMLYTDYDGPMNVDSWRFYQDTAALIAAEVMAGPNRTRFIACDPVAAGCLSDTIRTFGAKAFRRPLTDLEVQRFERLSQTTPPGTPEEVAQTTLYAFLVSPSFLQLTELTQEVEGTSIKLSQYEVAARLSFLLWGSVPDDVLTQAAAAGQLATKEQILAQAQRMIPVREKTAALVAGYHRAYLDMDNADSHWWKVSHDTTKYPLYSDALVPFIEAELDRFFEEVTFGGGTFKDIFLSNVGYVNNVTAPIYGLDPAAYGPELTQVTLDPATRPGFLTRAGFLSSYSRFDGTSPILRGAYITVNIIGVNPGAPDPNFFLEPAPEGVYTTERQYTEALTGQIACSGCHIPFVNPPGFVLENFDAIGKWQTIDPRANGDAATGTINATADVTLATGNVKTITSARQLMEEIGNLPAAKRIYAERWVTFATGRQPNSNDACTVDTIDLKMAQDGYTVLNLLADLTQADSFRLRVRGN